MAPCQFLSEQLRRCGKDENRVTDLVLVVDGVYSLPLSGVALEDLLAGELRGAARRAPLLLSCRLSSVHSPLA